MKYKIEENDSNELVIRVLIPRQTYTYCIAFTRDTGTLVIARAFHNRWFSCDGITGQIAIGEDHEEV